MYCGGKVGCCRSLSSREHRAEDAVNEAEDPMTQLADQLIEPPRGIRHPVGIDDDAHVVMLRSRNSDCPKPVLKDRWVQHISGNQLLE
ncbi:hypothetical protein GCM10023346_31440 [Arthrobacter gyeryongensis]|uniref:Uncharacterized protein n=1 Tax=Arthrobacter gyeryongensis TaxID=1650592 RepID=A0ABP9SJZ3_9MICC